ncbi:MAG: LicD family protein [Tannerella sp.]|jgi:lipopolysaccharide cholinephosphotransferase|nr:LicD family protein [Tannerella sp.]
MRAIDIDECHGILLSIAAAFDAICRRHAIPYYMLGGTMLGAVRHGGFIPWDDDMDFGVPRSDFPRLLASLAKELPAHMRVLTRDNGGFPVSNYIKIDDSRTLAADCWMGRAAETGVNIDVFPLDDGLQTAAGTRRFASYIYFLLALKDYICMDPERRRGMKRAVARLLRALCARRCAVKLLKYIDRSIVRRAMPDSGLRINFYGKWKKREIVSEKIFGQPRAYPFRGLTLCGVEDAGAYLAQLYGDYMRLPPECERNVHLAGMSMK